VLPYKTATQSGVVALAYHFETPMVVTNHKGLTAPILKDVTGVITAINATAIANGITELYANNNIDRFKENLLQTKANYAWETYAQEWANFTLNETTQH
jgi:glycosyltransferase involved in cell wall biosynthesis